MNNTEEKKEYVAPQMSVVELDYSAALLQGSDTLVEDDVIGD